MECVLQWLDDLDDIVSAIRLQAERLRRIALACLVVAAALAVLAAVIAVGQRYPDAAPLVGAGLLAVLLVRRVAGAHDGSGRRTAALRG